MEVRHQRGLDEFGRYPMVLFTKAHHTLGDVREALANFKHGNAKQIFLYKAEDQRDAEGEAITDFEELVNSMFYNQADAFIHVDYHM
jgi:hypothetical protein